MIECQSLPTEEKVPTAVRIWRQTDDVADTTLLSAIARGDHDTYAALSYRYSALLLGLLDRILQSHSEAEDVLQEVFLQVWHRARDFDERRGVPFVWLTMLARSRALDRLSTIASRQRVAARAGSAAAEIAQMAPDTADL